MSVTSSNSNKRIALNAAYISVATAFFLVAIKTFAWWLTGSMAMMASLIDSATDALSSLVTLFAVFYALKPADDEHRFGHGKAEGLAALAQGAFMCGSALFLVLQSVERFWNPQSLERLDIGLAVVVISIIATLGLVLIQRRAIAATGSLAIKADSLHYLGDLLAHLAVIIALVGTYFSWLFLDALMAIAIAIYLVYNAGAIVKESVNMLLDRELPTELQKKIVAIALADSRVHGVHDLRTRQSGQFRFVQLHLDIAGDTPLHAAHAISEDVEQALKRTFPDTDILIHQDPVDPSQDDSISVNRP